MLHVIAIALASYPLYPSQQTARRLDRRIHARRGNPFGVVSPPLHGPWGPVPGSTRAGYAGNILNRRDYPTYEPLHCHLDKVEEAHNLKATRLARNDPKLLERRKLVGPTADQSLGQNIVIFGAWRPMSGRETMSSIYTFKQLSRQEIPIAGGKGANLGEMTTAGFPVPPGFVLTTQAYDAFVAQNDLQERIMQAVASVHTDDPRSSESAAERIQSLFADAVISGDIEEYLLSAYAALSAEAVAVRSSATAEDLPSASFAGQQESYLNVRSPEVLRDAVKRCWASLWTARAITYRMRQGIAPDAVSLAVVVQQMVEAEAAGVLFTANPTNGRRDQIVINAAWGLGEAVVGGIVTPDQWVVDKGSGQVLSQQIAEKNVMTVYGPQGTTDQPVPEQKRRQSAISNEVVDQLVRHAVQIEEHYQTPMDIEWAVAHGKIWILQARPITALPEQTTQPVVTWESPIPGAKWVRRQVVEHMPDPLSPLFAELYLPALESSVADMQGAMGVPRLLREGLIDSPMFVTVNGYAYMRMDINLHWWTLPVIFPAMAMGVTRMLRNAGVRYWRDEILPAYQATVDRWRSVDLSQKQDEELLAGIQALARADAGYWFGAALAVGTAKVTDGLLDGFLKLAAPKRMLTSGHFSRGFHSKTLEAQVELEQIAARVRATETLRQTVLDAPVDQLWARLAQAPGGGTIIEELEVYLARYGHQIHTLDFAVPTLADDPIPVFVGMKNLVRDPGVSVHTRQTELAGARDALSEKLAASFDPVRRMIFLRLVALAQHFGPYREESLFFMGLGWPKLREMALALGNRLVDVGTLQSAEEIFYLRTDEIRTAIIARTGNQGLPELGAHARRQRSLHQEQARLHPPPAVPPTYGLKVGPLDLSSRESQKRNQADASTLNGFAVSPGVVRGPAVVIRSAADFHRMTPGAILVCPITTPAWTPLLGQAAGLVTDMGGVLAHGSIVAREYGIPAVLGTGVATQRITSGQTIEVDGNQGIVTVG